MGFREAIFVHQSTICFSYFQFLKTNFPISTFFLNSEFYIFHGALSPPSPCINSFLCSMTFLVFSAIITMHNEYVFV